MFRRITVYAAAAALALTLAPSRAPAADKTILELQRDVASLQEQVRQLKESQDKQLSALTVLVQQALDTSKSSTTGVAVIQSNLQQTLKDMEAKVVAPVVGLGSRLDGMDQDLRAVQQSVSDVNSLIGKVQQQLTDLNNAVKVLQSPPPAPPTTTSGGGAMPAGGAGSAAPDSTPTIGATELYANANRDRGSGKYDIAIQEYQDYLRWYGNTDYAPNAQFYIGVCHYNQAKYEEAVNDFDVVLEKYPENNKTPDALFQKGLALQKMSRLTDSHTEFLELIKRYPKNDNATRACDQLKTMGYNCGVPRTSSPATKAPAKKKK
jgi:tol-pal system protein YbgF